MFLKGLGHEIELNYLKKSIVLVLNNQCCGSGIFIPDPGSCFLPILDPGSKNSNKREGWKQICCHTFICIHKFHIIENYFIEILKKKIWANFQRNKKLFTQKIVTKLSKIWVWDPGSGKNLFRIQDPGSRGQKSTGSRIRIRNTAKYLNSSSSSSSFIYTTTGWSTGVATFQVFYATAIYITCIRLITVQCIGRYEWILPSHPVLSRYFLFHLFQCLMQVKECYSLLLHTVSRLYDDCWVMSAFFQSCRGRGTLSPLVSL